VIPNYNGQKFLKNCLDSLLIQTERNFDIIIVDNNSADDSVKFVEANYPSVKVIRLDKNYGFSKAVNAGISYSLKNPEIKYIVLLNNDVECDKNFVSELLKGFKYKSTGSVASKMLNYKNRKLIDNTGLFLDLSDFPYLRGNNETDSGQYDKGEFVFGCCAGAGMYLREVFENAGLFDEDFFAYNEDIDLDIRMQLKGYKSFYNPDAVCYHIGSATSVHNSPFKVYLGERNIVLLRAKNYPVKLLLKFMPLIIYNTSKRFVKYLIRDTPAVFLSAVKGTFSGLLFSKKYFRKQDSKKDFDKVPFSEIKFMPSETIRKEC
jgi:GT2 family glycosyltransferase